jgi:hypothetical protein
VAVAALSAAAANAAVFTLADAGQNSSMLYDTSTGNWSQWNVEGVNQIFERSYYFRIGAAGETKVNDVNLTLTGADHYDGNFFLGEEGLAVEYTDPAGGFAITINTVLTAGAPGSNQATFTESVRIDNFGRTPLAFTLFLYADYDLGQSAFNDSLVFGDPRTLTQTFGAVVHEASVTVTPTRIEASYFSTLQNDLQDGLPTTLNNVASLFNGDLVYAFQWDLLIAPNSSFTLGNTNSITVPEVSALGLLGFACGASGFAFLRRRK